MYIRVSLHYAEMGGEEYKDGMEGERIERGREECRGSFIILYICFRDKKGPR